MGCKEIIMEAPDKRELMPALPKEIVASQGGCYQVWLSSYLRMLSEEGIGAAKLILNHLGLSFPNYSDFSKVFLCNVYGFIPLPGYCTPGQDFVAYFCPRQSQSVL